jgi:hypothetical protein
LGSQVPHTPTLRVGLLGFLLLRSV